MNLLINSTDCAIHSRAIALAITTQTTLNGVEAIVAAEFIQQLHYWTEKGSGIFKDGTQWIYNSYDQWINTQFPTLTKYHFRKIKNALLDSGLISVAKLRNKQWNQTYHYALEYEALLELNELKPLKNSKVKTMDHQSSADQTIDNQNVELSYTKSTSIEDLQRKKEDLEPEKSSDQINSSPGQSPQSPEEPATNLFVQPKKSSENDISNSPEEPEFPQVDEKVNKERKSDRYFGQKKPSQQEQIRRRAKVESAIGMSGFKDVEDLRKCQKELTIYFAKQLDPLKAAEKASFVIKAERQGERSPFVQDYLDGLAIGSWAKKEWEAEPGVIFPVFRGYLLNKLRRGEDTREQVNVKIAWFLKDLKATEDAWGECKRLIDLEKPRLIEAVKRGQDLSTTNIPLWIIDAYRPEISIEQVAPTAEILSQAAIAYTSQVKRHQESLSPGVEDIPQLPADSPVRKILEGYGCSQPSDIEKREQVDQVMDQVAEDAIEPEQEEDTTGVSISSINNLLADPITREEGIKLAKKQDLPLVYNDLGEVIAVDSVAEEPVRENYQAHKIYQPDQVQKGSKSAWEAAIARSKFLTNRLKKS